MKILLLITDLEIGGTPTVVRELALRLRPRHTVMVACLSKWGPVADQLREAGVPVVALGAKGAAELPATLFKLIRLIRREKFDLVFSFLIHANFVAAAALPFCGKTRFLQSVQTTQPKPRWHWILQSLIQVAAERVVVPSKSAARCAMDWADVPEEKIAIIPNAVDRERTLGRRAATDGEQRHTIGFIGRLDPIKRVPDLLAAMASLDSSYQLAIYGEGADRPRIEREIGRLRLKNRVKLHGVIANPSQALCSIDVLVLPSAAEGFGLVLIEAMAAGVPVVATDVPGIRDVVTDGRTGLLVPVESPREIARAVRRVCEDLKLRDRLVEQGSAEVNRRFSWENVLGQYESLLAPV